MKLNSRRLPIQTILLIVNLTILALPLGSIYFLKLLEDEQVRQTEVELVAQGASIAAITRQLLQTQLQKEKTNLSEIAQSAADAPSQKRIVPEKLYISKDQILPERPNPRQTNQAPIPLLSTLGKQINPILKSIQQTTLAGLRVLDFNGIVIASSGEELGMSYAHISDVQQALQGTPVSLLRQRSSEKRVYSLLSTSRDTGLRVFVSLPLIADKKVIGAVLLSRTPKSVKKMLYDQKESVLAAMAILLCIVLLLTVLTSLTITRPLKNLIQQTKKVAEGKGFQKPNLNRPGVEEIHLLTKAIAEMTEKIEYRSNYIQNFAMNVSHEFKSPLTSINGAIELLQNYYDSMSPEKRDRFFQNIAQDTHRLQRLVSRLLELARADVLEAGKDKTNLLEVLAHQQKHYEKLKLRIRFNPTQSPIFLPIERETLETITANLFQNSLQHGANRVSIKIKENQPLMIQFIDNGVGISKANAGKIFTPFFTTNREKGGTGLGLQIVQSLLNAHQGNIRHIPTPKGATFEISFS